MRPHPPLRGDCSAVCTKPRLQVPLVVPCAPAPPPKSACSAQKNTRPWTGTGYCDSDTAPRGTTLNCPGGAGTTRSRNGADRPALLDSGWLLGGEFTVLSCAGIPPSPVLYRTETATTPRHCMWVCSYIESINGNTEPSVSQSDFRGSIAMGCTSQPYLFPNDSFFRNMCT
jgi:hypothetical protein